MSPSRPSLAIVGLLMVTLVAACSSGSATFSTSAGASALTSASAAPSTAPSAAPIATPTKLKVGLGYIPSVQFAPFYLALQAGYYAQAGLDVELQNKIDQDLIPLVGQGAIDVGIADGTSIVPAVSQGIPVQYVATIYGQLPNIVFAKASSGIKTAADLKGRKIGVPGRYGSGWIALQILLGSANLTTDDVQIIEYPDFTQRAAVAQGAVDAATGFANNEPVQLELDGDPAVVLHIDRIIALPGPGLISGTGTLETKHDAIAAFVAATLRAMKEIKADPQVGLDAAIKAVPELASAREAQTAILAATIATWEGPLQRQHGLGALDLAGWQASIPYFQSLGVIKKPVTVQDLVRTDLLPAGG